MAIFSKKEKFEYKDEYRYPLSVMINVTDSCNLACKYCFVEQHPHFMTLQIAKDIVDWMYKNYTIKKDKQILLHQNDHPHINWFGGEPMLMYKEIIVPITLYAEEKYPNIFSFGMTTNCTLLSKESIDFFAEHNYDILASIDGAEKTQCYNRPCRNGDNSSKLIEKNISYLLEKIPNICFRSTIYAPTVQYLYENYLYAESLGFKQYAAAIDERHKWTKQQFQILNNELSKIFLHQAEHLIKKEPIMELNNYTFLRNAMHKIILNQYEIATGVLRCGLGTVSCAVGWDGKIYGCQQDVSPNKKNVMYIGNIYTGIDKNKHIKLLKLYSNNLKYARSYYHCHNCILRDFCNSTSDSGCPSTSYTLLNDMHKVSKIRCQLFQIMFKQYLLYENIIYLKYENKKEE